MVVPATGVNDAGVVVSVSEVDVGEGIKEPNAVVANREEEPADACLVRSTSTLQCALEADLRFDDILELTLSIQGLLVLPCAFVGKGAMAMAEARSPNEPVEY